LSLSTSSNYGAPSDEDNGPHEEDNTPPDENEDSPGPVISNIEFVVQNSQRDTKSNVIVPHPLYTSTPIYDQILEGVWRKICL
jgi:hypothetical protein